MDAKQKYLIVASTFPAGADDAVTARFIYDLARALTEKYEVTVICPHSPGAKKMEIMDGVRVYRFRYAFPSQLEGLTSGEGMLFKIKANPLLWMTLPSFMLAELISVVRFIKRENICLVNSHWAIPQGLVAAFARGIIPFRHIMSVHAADIFALKRYGRPGSCILRYILRRTDMVFPVSTYIKDAVTEVAKMGFAYKVIPMGVDMRKFMPRQKSRTGKFRFLFVGKLVQKKGLKYLLEAAAILKEARRDFQICVVGSGRDLLHYKRMADLLGVSELVTFEGWVANEKLHAWYHESDALVVPSVFDKKGETEGMPVVLLESMACGVPVIASSISGIVDIVKDGYNGLLFEPGNSSDLAHRMKQVMESNMEPYQGRCIETARQYSTAIIAKHYHAFACQ